MSNDANLYKIEEVANQKELKYLRRGTTRRVYATKSGNYVIKFPRSPLDEISNKEEAQSWNKKDWKLAGKLAKCRLISLNGMICLIMERVESLYEVMEDNHPNDRDERITKWAANLNDGPQVGINRKGKILVYDWAKHYSDNSDPSECY
jgi:hypothetical protein